LVETDHTRKVGLIHGQRFATQARLRLELFEYVEIKCNRNPSP
jgi:hypothetical protein